MVNIMFLGNQLPLRMPARSRAGVLATRARRAHRDHVWRQAYVVERLIDLLILLVLLIAADSQTTFRMRPPAKSRTAATAFGGSGNRSASDVSALLSWRACRSGLAYRLLDGLLGARTRPLSGLPLAKSMLSISLDGVRPLDGSCAALARTAVWTVAGLVASPSRRSLFRCIWRSASEVDYCDQRAAWGFRSKRA